MRAAQRRSVVATVIGVLVASLVAACGTTTVRWRSAPAGTPTGTVKPSASPSGTPLSAADACVASTIASMSLAQMAGQVMLVGTSVSDIPAIDKTITTYHIGGVFLRGDSSSSAASLRKQITAIQAVAPADARLLISLDQEGGEVQSLKGADFPTIPSELAQGKLSAPALAAQSSAWAKRLAAIGVNLDLAPVADTVPAALGTRNPPIGELHREYGSDPVLVAAAIRTTVPSMQKAGVITTLKHFPGLGRVLVNTDFSKNAIDTVATTDDPYLEPFKAGIAVGTGAVMISSASYPKLDPDSIATFSKPIVTGLLRQQLGFTGLIVSDSLAGAAAISSVPVGQRAVRFIEAGGDFVLTTAVSKAAPMINGLIAEGHASAAFTAQLKAAATYVLRTKSRAGLLSCAP